MIACDSTVRGGEWTIGGSKDSETGYSAHMLRSSLRNMFGRVSIISRSTFDRQLQLAFFRRSDLFEQFNLIQGDESRSASSWTNSLRVERLILGRDTQVFARFPRVETGLGIKRTRTNYTRDRLNLASFLLGMPKENQSRICDVQNDASGRPGSFRCKIDDGSRAFSAVSSILFSSSRGETAGERKMRFLRANETSPARNLAFVVNGAR